MAAIPVFLRSSTLVGMVGLIVSASCQNYVASPLDPRSTAVSFGKRRLDDPQVRTALLASGHMKRGESWPPNPWGLRELQGAALVYHPEIEVAKAKAASAAAAVTTAGTAPNPSLSLGPSVRALRQTVG